MKKVLKRSLAVAAIGSIFCGGIAMADMLNDRPFTDFGVNGEAPLQAALNQITNNTGPNVITGQSSSAIWTESDGNANAFKVYSYTGARDLTFGIYSFTSNAMQEFIFGGPRTEVSFYIANDGTLAVDQGDGTTDYIAGFGNYFGFYLQQGNLIAYTEDSKNTGGAYGDTDGTVMALAYLLGEGVQVNTGTITDPTNGGLSVFDTVTTKGNDDWLIAFEDWYPGDRDFQDNIFFIEDIAAVPEPTTMLLFGAGLAGLAGARRRIKK